MFPLPQVAPLLSTGDFYSWSIVAALTVLALWTIPCIDDRRYDDAQRLALIAIAICMVGVVAILMWDPPAAWGAR